MIEKKLWAGIFSDSEITDEYFRMCMVDTKDSLFEKHHILPKSIFPEYTKEPWNIVRLSYRDHYTAHELLTQMCIAKINKHKMLRAWGGMCGKSQNKFIDTDTYQTIKEAYLISIRGENSPMYGKRPSKETLEKQRLSRLGNQHRLGKPHTDETKALISKNNTGRRHTEESKERMSISNKGKVRSPDVVLKMSERMLGTKLSEETKAKIADSSRNRSHSEESKNLMSSNKTLFLYKQYSMQSEFIRDWTPCQLRQSTFVLRSIRAVCRGRSKSHNGFRWCRELLQDNPTNQKNL